MSPPAPPTSSPADTPIYFWKLHTRDGYMCQWYPSPFTDPAGQDPSHVYPHCEQYMMHRKALLFSPSSAVTAEILATTDPKDCKALGRQVENFDEETWRQHRYQIVVDANVLKFGQDEELRRWLLATGERELVEASPRDRIWGIGYGAQRAPEVRAKWGLNLLGKALVEVREKLREGEAESKS